MRTAVLLVGWLRASQVIAETQSTADAAAGSFRNSDNAQAARLRVETLFNAQQVADVLVVPVEIEGTPWFRVVAVPAENGEPR